MPRNKLVLLDAIIAERQAERKEKLDDATAFELFASEQALANYELSEEELVDGLVGGGQDGGIDGVYIFLENLLLSEDHELFTDPKAASAMPRQASLELVMIQAKRTPSFGESALTTVKATFEQLLDLEKSETDLLTYYNAALVSKAMLYRRALLKLASKHPKSKTRFIYATRGDTSEIGVGVQTRSKQLKQCLEESASSASVEFFGAKELWEAASLVQTYTLQLPYDENVTLGTSYAALVSLEDYLSFITDDSGALRRYIFEMNVRDYQGGVEVNKKITETLQDGKAPEFWWLNNGVTVICSHASIIGKLFNLDDVQIVNGLQTSFTLYETLKKGKKAGHEDTLNKHVLVRVLVTSDAAVRDQVIRATNSQTSVPTASLRATDDLQREIEKYLSQHDWFYDRRKNYYKNIGKSRDRIIGIPYLAQAVIAAGLSQPDQARARPSSLLKNDNDYKSIFDTKLDLTVYLFCLELQKQADNFLTAFANSTEERSNLRFHLATLIAWRKVGQIIYKPSQLTKLANNKTVITENDLRASYKELTAWVETFAKETGAISNDHISKNSKFVDYMKKQSGLK